MKKDNQMIYTYVDGKYKLVTKNTPTQNGYGANTQRYAPVVDPAKDFFLSKSPFLYSPNNCPYKIESVEEFYSIVKRKNVPYGDVIRNPKLSRREKIRISKKTFKRWKKIYDKEIINNLNETERTLASVDKITVEPIDTRLNIFLIFIAFIVTMITYTKSAFWDAFKRFGFGAKLHDYALEGVQNIPWMQIVGMVTLILIILLYCFIVFYNSVGSTMRGKFNFSKNALNDNNKKLKKKQKKDFKKALKYYIKEIKRSKKNVYIKPLPIEKVAIHSGDIAKFELYQSSLKTTVLKYQKQKRVVVAFNKIMTIIVTLGWVSVVGCFIYTIIKKLLF